MKRVLFIMAVALLIYGFFIEPNWLDVSHHEVIGNVKTTIKIAHITDLHFRKFGYLERKVRERIETESPDIILVTGDILDSEKSIQPAKIFFENLKIPMGIWAVLGNWENWKNLNTIAFFNSINIHLLNNEIVKINEDLTLVGFDDYLTGSSPRFVASESNIKEFCIELFHSPEQINQINGKCPLALAGHTHGGQVRIPFLGPLWLPRGSGKYIQGWYEKNGTKLYVNRGIGTSILPIRFLARPEIAFITIRSGE